jgi:hypothetical protein
VSDNTRHSRQTNIHAPVGFEPTISAGERLKTYALERTAAGTGMTVLVGLQNGSSFDWGMADHPTRFHCILVPNKLQIVYLQKKLTNMNFKKLEQYLDMAYLLPIRSTNINYSTTHKVRFHPVEGHTGPEGSRSIALLFHDLGTRWGWVVSVMPRPPLPLGKTRYPLYRRVGGRQGRSGWV